MKDPRIPLYLITGFLDSGKTTLLTDTLNMDYFADGQRTVLLMCEDGETEYDPEQLSRLNTRLVPVQDQAQLNTSFLQEIDRRYQPERVLLEYNGMWPIQILRDLKLPIQTVITCTGLDEFVNNRFSINKIFHIKNGNAVKAN